ncbi:KGK domain-containing protein [Trichormus variabilis]|uniref:KGK domain-containing protein n=1 Tax=Trichormus variabilis SAG 1403-4b TaxID=447716 RepID=A0A433V0L9_ANAVA|nr:KGK domain-containing protein [Trichormus variabilis]MBD2625260.1 hypothetical protein [Trichormus variabilis FACHB-164]RUS99631.1 hypothetical protein DSM107003_02150 [Trichormus variabilis SAG 1403-4b]
MSNTFIPLECNDDVIQISNDSFTVSRLKELVINGILEKKPLSVGNNVNIHIGNCLDYLGNFKIYDQDIHVDDLQLQITKDCQLLKIGNKGWQTGKIKIKMSISPLNKSSDYVDLEFCPDEPEIPESPLDDLRKMINNM